MERKQQSTPLCIYGTEQQGQKQSSREQSRQASTFKRGERIGKGRGETYRQVSRTWTP